jgi:hypothetical protein
MTALILVMLVLVSMKQTQLSPSKCYCGVFCGISWICVQRSAAVLSVFPFSLKYEFEDVTGIDDTSFKAILGLLFTCGNIHHAGQAKGHICLAVVIDVILFWSTRLSPDTMQVNTLLYLFPFEPPSCRPPPMENCNFFPQGDKCHCW